MIKNTLFFFFHTVPIALEESTVKTTEIEKKMFAGTQRPKANESFNFEYAKGPKKAPSTQS